ncbi:FAD-dependent monooxygenase [Paenibacillus sinopodophylli]|uniref:FAD-dependent monooxygenase n=1 Tax=Paenibacillus sinopodophylli TaxID=1837342 RepID=UPI00148687BA|nr:FAD-dependent monooxygenase [Paenibacillus sinopodophylli]
MGDFLLGSIVPAEDGSYELGSRRLAWAWYDNTRNNLLRRRGCVDGNVVRHSLNGSGSSEQTLIELVEQASVRWPQPWLAVTLHSIRSRNLTGIPVAECIPIRLSRGRIAIVGDAAHVLTPITAAGFNAFLLDAAVLLAECIAESLRGTSGIESLLPYQARRLNDVRQLVRSG